VFSDVEMTGIDYTVDSVNICGKAYRPINITCNLSGMIYNGYGNRAIVLDDVQYALQVLAFDTIYWVKPSPDAIWYSPEPKESPVAHTMEKYNEAFEDTWLSEDFDLPSLRYKGKPFICLDRQKLILRLPPDAFDEALDIPGTLYFNPNEADKPKEGWIQVPWRQREHWDRLANIAAAYMKE
jgi:hypothetical protein